MPAFNRRAFIAITKMKLRVALWLLSLALFLASLAVLGPTLPARVATHFGAAGQANGWMTRSGHLVLSALFGVGFSSFIIGLCYVIRFLPPCLLNVPHPEYWRAPGHYREACDYLFRESFWLGTLLSLWMTGLHGAVVAANSHTPPHLDAGPILGIAAVFLVGLALWTIRLWRHFSRVPKEEHQS